MQMNMTDFLRDKSQLETLWDLVEKHEGFENQMEFINKQLCQEDFDLLMEVEK